MDPSTSSDQLVPPAGAAAPPQPPLPPLPDLLTSNQQRHSRRKGRFQQPEVLATKGDLQARPFILHTLPPATTPYPYSKTGKLLKKKKDKGKSVATNDSTASGAPPSKRRKAALAPQDKLKATIGWQRQKEREARELAYVEEQAEEEQQDHNDRIEQGQAAQKKDANKLDLYAQETKKLGIHQATRHLVQPVPFSSSHDLSLAPDLPVVAPPSSPRVASPRPDLAQVPLPVAGTPLDSAPFDAGSPPLAPLPPAEAAPASSTPPTSPKLPTTFGLTLQLLGTVMPIVLPVISHVLRNLFDEIRPGTGFAKLVATQGSLESLLRGVVGAVVIVGGGGLGNIDEEEEDSGVSQVDRRRSYLTNATDMGRPSRSKTTEAQPPKIRFATLQWEKYMQECRELEQGPKGWLQDGDEERFNEKVKALTNVDVELLFEINQFGRRLHSDFQPPPFVPLQLLPALRAALGDRPPLPNFPSRYLYESIIDIFLTNQLGMTKNLNQAIKLWAKRLSNPYSRNTRADKDAQDGDTDEEEDEEEPKADHSARQELTKLEKEEIHAVACTDLAVLFEFAVHHLPIPRHQDIDWEHQKTKQDLKLPDSVQEKLTAVLKLPSLSGPKVTAPVALVKSYLQHYVLEQIRIIGFELVAGIFLGQHTVQLDPADFTPYPFDNPTKAAPGSEPPNSIYNSVLKDTASFNDTLNKRNKGSQQTHEITLQQIFARGVVKLRFETNFPNTLTSNCTSVTPPSTFLLLHRIKKVRLGQANGAVIDFAPQAFSINATATQHLAFNQRAYLEPLLVTANHIESDMVSRLVAFSRNVKSEHEVDRLNRIFLRINALRHLPCFSTPSRQDITGNFSLEYHPNFLSQADTEVGALLAAIGDLRKRRGNTIGCLNSLKLITFHSLFDVDPPPSPAPTSPKSSSPQSLSSPKRSFARNLVTGVLSIAGSTINFNTKSLAKGLASTESDYGSPIGALVQQRIESSKKLRFDDAAVVDSHTHFLYDPDSSSYVEGTFLPLLSRPGSDTPSRLSALSDLYRPPSLSRSARTFNGHPVTWYPSSASSRILANLLARRIADKFVSPEIAQDLDKAVLSYRLEYKSGLAAARGREEAAHKDRGDTRAFKSRLADAKEPHESITMEDRAAVLSLKQRLALLEHKTVHVAIDPGYVFGLAIEVYTYDRDGKRVSRFYLVSSGGWSETTRDFQRKVSSVREAMAAAMPLVLERSELDDALEGHVDIAMNEQESVKQEEGRTGLQDGHNEAEDTTDDQPAPDHRLTAAVNSSPIVTQARKAKDKARRRLSDQIKAEIMELAGAGHLWRAGGSNADELAQARLNTPLPTDPNLFTLRDATLPFDSQTTFIFHVGAGSAVPSSGVHNQSWGNSVVRELEQDLYNRGIPAIFISTQEHGTSKMSPCCTKDDGFPRWLVAVLFIDGGVCHRLLRCEGCGTVYHRDAVACSNIRISGAYEICFDAQPFRIYAGGAK